MKNYEGYEIETSPFPPESYWKERERLEEIIKLGREAEVDLDRLNHRYPMRFSVRIKNEKLYKKVEVTVL